MGRVLAALKESGQQDNTIVVLFSDHGFHCGEKGLSGKHTLWEESTRVPLIFAGPSIPGNTRCSEAVELLDLYPTLSDLCRLPSPKNVEGLSLMPQFRNPETKRIRPAICTSSPGSHSVRDEQWRLIHYADGSRELYDCLTDPDEFENVVTQKANAEVISRLARWLPKDTAPPVPGSLSKMVSQRADGWYYENTKIEPATSKPN